MINCVIKYELSKFFLGKDLNNDWYMISKNKLNTSFKVGKDYGFFTNVTKGFVFRKVVPVEVKLYL